jgi:hypothetical protein
MGTRMRNKKRKQRQNGPEKKTEADRETEPNKEMEK